MLRWGKKLAGKGLTVFLALGLWCLPAGATVPGDIAAGLPLDQVIANGLAAGMPLEDIISPALDAGANYCELLKEAVKFEEDVCSLFKVFIIKCQTEAKLKEFCTSCTLMRCAVAAGRDCVEVANCFLWAGVRLEDVRACMLAAGCPGAEAYAYAAPPPFPVPGQTFPGGGEASISR